MVDEYTLIQRAKSLGYQAEIYEVKVRGFTIKRGSQVYSFDIADQGYGMRVIKDGKLGFAFSTKLDDTLFELAVDSSKVAKEDKFNIIPSPESVNKLNLKFFDINDAKEKVKEYEEVIREVRNFANVIGEYYNFAIFTVKVVNSEGIDVEEDRSLAEIALSFNFKRDSFITPEFYEDETARDLSKVDPHRLVEKVRERDEIFKARQTLDKKFKEAVFTPKAISILLSPLLSYAVSLENLYRGRTTLKEGEVINENLTVVDNPTINWAPFSRSFDGEGLPSMKVEVISNGVVKTFLSNTYWAKRTGKLNTHSSYRSYSSLPIISTSVIDIDVRSNAEEDTIVIDEVQGVHTSNFDTGEFSVVGSVAWYNGIATREVVITGNLKDMLKGIIGGIGEKELKGNVYTKALKIGNINVA